MHDFTTKIVETSEAKGGVKEMSKMGKCGLERAKWAAPGETTEAFVCEGGEAAATVRAEALHPLP